MDNNKKKMIFLVIVGIIITFGVIVIINMLPYISFSLKEASAIAVIGGADGPTTIYIGSSHNWKLSLLYLLLLLAIDAVALIIIKTIEYKRKKSINLKYPVIFILIFDIILLMLLFQDVILLILNIIISMM